MFLKHSGRLRRLACVVAPTTLVIALAVVVPGQALAGTPKAGSPNNAAVAWEEIEWDEVTYDNGQVVSVKHGKDRIDIPPSGEGKPPQDGGVSIASAEGGEGGSGNCKNVWARRVGHSLLGFVTYKFEHWKYFCWNYPTITYVEGSHRWLDVDPNFLVRGQWGDGYWYEWRGAAHGGQTSYRQGQIENCILHYGCLGTFYPYVQIWINGNGAWTYSTSG